MSRRNQLYTILFNKVNSSTLWGTKFLYIAFAIQCAFLAIRYFHASIVLGILCYFALTNICIVYSVIFDTAYKIPVKVSMVQREAILMSKRLMNRTERQLVAKRVRSLKSVGIEIGGFETVARNASLSFVDFVVGQVVGLLVSFP